MHRYFGRARGAHLRRDGRGCASRSSRPASEPGEARRVLLSRCQRRCSGVVDPDRMKIFRFEAGRLQYEIDVDLEGNTFSISGDFTNPFAFNSLFEIYVPFDRIAIETESRFYGDQKILVCRKDYPNRPNFKTLMVIKWPDSELSVWPSQCVLNVPQTWVCRTLSRSTQPQCLLPRSPDVRNGHAATSELVPITTAP